jgi:uncharacterized protein
MPASPKPCLTAITLGVADMARSIRFYEALGFPRRMRGTGEEVAFCDAGGVILALYSWDKLAAEAALQREPRPAAFRGTMLAWNRASPADVAAAMAHALACGASLIKKPCETTYGGYAGYFADPDGHPWEIVCAPGFRVGDDGRVSLPD